MALCPAAALVRILGLKYMTNKAESHCQDGICGALLISDLVSTFVQFKMCDIKIRRAVV